MDRSYRLSPTLVRCSIAIGVCALTQWLFLGTARADDPVCTTLPGAIVVTGSTSIQPELSIIGPSLPSGSALVFAKSSSCLGVTAMLNGSTSATATTAIYWQGGGSATALTCTLPASTPIDIAVSDLYATSCPTVTSSTVAAASLGDFDDFFAEVPELVVPGGDGGSTQTAISASAAYLTFGFGSNGATPWNDQSQFLIRNNTASPQVIFSTALQLNASKWLGFDESNRGGAGQIFLDIKNRVIPDPAHPTDNTKSLPGDPKKLIGLVSSSEADTDVVNVKRLAFKSFGQTCAYWPDSGVSEKDKAYVRDGHYPIWGPLHLFAKVGSNGVPTSVGAKAVIDQMTAQTKALLDVEISAHVVPMCAMNVARSSEMGALSSVQPAVSCGCYFDSITKTGGVGSGCVACTAANAATKCTGAAKVCNYGYCELQ